MDVLNFNFDLVTSSALVAALAYTALALRLPTADRRSGALATLLFYGAVIASAAWGWAIVAQAHFVGVPVWLSMGADLVRYGLWLAFLLSVLAPIIEQRSSGGVRALRPAAAVLLLLGFVALLTGRLGLPDASVWTRLGLFDAVALPLFGLILLEQLFRNIADDSRWNAKPLCVGLGVVFAFDLYLSSQAVLFGRLDADAGAIRGAIHALAVPLLLIASRRRRDWIARLRLSRKAAFHSATLLLAGIYLLCVAAAGYYIRFFGGEWGSALQLGALVVALFVFVALAVSATMRAWLRVLVGKHFFSYRYDYREEWLRFTAMLSAKGSPAEMGTRVIRGMADLVESPGGALWTLGPEPRAFVQLARWNAPAAADHEPVDSALSRFLLETGWVVDLEAVRTRPDRYAGLVLPPWLTSGAHRYWLLIPLIVADELIGFVALDPPRTRIDLNWEVTDLLKTASRQAAGFLAQMRATEALLEARKFDAFNRMSAFVVHDLKNIVTQLSLMMKNSKRLHANPEFQKDMLATVESSLEKMRQLMLQLREGQAPAGGQSGVDLLPIVRRIEAVAAERGRTVDVLVTEPVSTRGHEERIERVLGHVVQNALDATQPTERVWLKLGRCSGQVQVEIGDTGQGMSQEYVRTRLFRPFESTKRTGMGIGAYESFQYVRELGGSITVDSEPQRGTVMTIALPLFEPHSASVLESADAK